MSSTPLIPPSPSYWPPLAHTAPIFIRLIAAVFATFPTTPSVCAPLRLWRELRPVTWGINCVVETCILWGMRGRCRPSFGSAVVPRTGGEGTAGLRLCYWRSYGAGRDIYCLREGFHASLNLNSGHGGPFFPFFCAGAFLLTVHYFICIVFMQRNVQVKLSFIPLLKN